MVVVCLVAESVWDEMENGHVGSCSKILECSTSIYVLFHVKIILVINN